MRGFVQGDASKSVPDRFALLAMMSGQPMGGGYKESLMGNRECDSKLLAQRPGRSGDR